MDDVLWMVLVLLPKTGGSDVCRVLDGIDAHRSLAYARLDPGAVAAQYAASAGGRDLETVEEYRSRGVRVSGGRVQRRSCREASDGSLRVSERLGPAVAVLPGGERRALPREPWQDRIVRLVVGDGRWRIASVGEGSAAAAGSEVE